MSDEKPGPVMDPRPQGLIRNHSLQGMTMRDIYMFKGVIEDINFTNGRIVDSNLSGVTVEGCTVDENTMINGIPLLTAMRAYRAAHE